MLQSNDLSRSFTALNQDNTLIVVIEMSQSGWLVAGVPVIRQRRPMTEARLKANRENAKKGGRPRGSMNGDKLSLRERCRVRDEEHVRILEAIAADSTHPGFQLVAIRDLMDRGWGRPSQMVEGTGPGGAIPFSVILPCAISNDDD